MKLPFLDTSMAIRCFVVTTYAHNFPKNNTETATHHHLQDLNRIVYHTTIWSSHQTIDQLESTHFIVGDSLAVNYRLALRLPGVLVFF
jgi:hypothetical protein